MDLQVVLLDRHARPHAIHERTLGQQGAVGLDERQQDLDGAAAERDRLPAAQQQALAPAQDETAECIGRRRKLRSQSGQGLAVQHHVTSEASALAIRPCTEQAVTWITARG